MTKIFYYLFKMFPSLEMAAHEAVLALYGGGSLKEPGIKILRSTAFGNAKYVRQQADRCGSAIIVDDATGQTIMTVYGKNDNNQQSRNERLR